MHMSGHAHNKSLELLSSGAHLAPEPMPLDNEITPSFIKLSLGGFGRLPPTQLTSPFH